MCVPPAYETKPNYESGEATLPWDVLISSTSMKKAYLLIN